MIPKSTAVAALDKYNIAVQSSLTSGTANPLPSVASAFNNSLWYELENGVPVLKFRRGDVTCTKRHDKVVKPVPTLWLPCSTTTIKDKRGNTWSTGGSPSIQTDANAISGKSLYLPNISSYARSSTFYLCEQNFTFDCWLNVSSKSVYANNKPPIIVGIKRYTGTYPDYLVCTRTDDSITRVVLFKHKYTTCMSTNWTGKYFSSFTVDTRVHFEVDYICSERKILGFVNGCLEVVFTDAPQYERAQYKVIIGDDESKGNSFVGTVEHLRVYDGIARHTANFTPPTANDYA